MEELKECDFLGSPMPEYEWIQQGQNLPLHAYPYSTVTDFAKFLGLSTSLPRATEA